MFIRSITTVNERPRDGIAGTNFVNEVVQAVRGLQDIPPEKTHVNGFRVGAVVRIRIDAAASGGGKYTGYTLGEPAVTLAATGDLTDAELGVEETECLIFNMVEVGSSDHQITDNGINVSDYFGQIIGVTASDDTGILVVAIWGVDPGPC